MDEDISTGYDACHTATKGAILLTGGRSQRMGQDKSEILVEGEQLASRLARLLSEAGWQPCILGRRPVAGFAFLPDREDFQGPLSALRCFEPRTDFVFVLSCDVPLFDAKIPDVFFSVIERFDAVIPTPQDRAQPLCALYRASSWETLKTLDSPRVLDWVDRLSVTYLNDQSLVDLGIETDGLANVNSPEELESLLARVTPAID